MIKTFTPLLELQLGRSQTSLMKPSKAETYLSVVGNLYYLFYKNVVSKVPHQ